MSGQAAIPEAARPHTISSVDSMVTVNRLELKRREQWGPDAPLYDPIPSGDTRSLRNATRRLDTPRKPYVNGAQVSKD